MVGCGEPRCFHTECTRSETIHRLWVNALESSAFPPHIHHLYYLPSLWNFSPFSPRARCKLAMSDENWTLLQTLDPNQVFVILGTACSVSCRKIPAPGYRLAPFDPSLLYSTVLIEVTAPSDSFLSTEFCWLPVKSKTKPSDTSLCIC